VKLYENGNPDVIFGHCLKALMATFHLLKYFFVTIVNALSEPFT
jgi:hypothetical protein